MSAPRPVPCPLCGALDQQPLYRPRYSPGPVVRCRRCAMVYVSPRLDTHALIFDGPTAAAAAGTLSSADLTDVQDSWEWPLLQAKEAERPALDRNSRQPLAILRDLTGRPGRLLDFGCGGGFFLGAAKAEGWQVFGLEPLPGHAIYARARFGAQVITDTLRADSFAPGQFDAITAFQVFEHLPQPRENLQQLARFLRPGGALLIEVPNIANWGVRLLGPRHRHFVQDHLNFFSAATLSRLLADGGLTVRGHYFPSRTLTWAHLLGHWGARVLPGSLGRRAQALARRPGFAQRRARLNLGDIVAVYGVKPNR
ncbi:MAG: class I SAM-dependent methyltransferase [Anaerolineales bacterium]|nr:class I SAM-dependent methyltransferase [Anaerolineales bacterium]